MAAVIPHDPLSPVRSLHLDAPPGRRRIAAKDAQLLLSATELLERARTEAEAIRVQAQAERAAERQRGYEQGLAEGRQAAAAEAADRALQTAHYVDTLDASLADVVMRAVRKIISEFSNGELVARAVRLALSPLREESRLRIWIDEGADALAEQRIADVLQAHPRPLEVDIARRPGLGPHACLVESATGYVEVNLDELLASIARTLQVASTPAATVHANG